MRKMLFFFLLLSVFVITSCTDTFYMTKKTTFDNAIRTVQAQMSEQGYFLNGTSSNTRNETVVTGVSYSRYTGYGTAMDNNFITQDNYQFTDTLGNTMSFSVSYMAKQTDDGIPYVEDLELCGCETSNPKYYETLCGNESIVKQINDVPKDQKVEKVNVMNTTLAASGIILGITLIIVLMGFANS